MLKANSVSIEIVAKLCADQWSLVGNKCIYKNDTSADWNENRINCQAMDASMVKIKSKEENELLINMINKENKGAKYYWIGGRNTFIGSKIFEWSDGSAMIYKNWATGDPNNVDHKNGACANIHLPEGEWYDYYCDMAVSWTVGQLCEKKIDCSVLNKQDEETRKKFAIYCEKDIEYKVKELSEKIESLKKFMYKYYGEDPTKFRSLLRNRTLVDL
ncbi:hypothetical protein B4U80_11710 [Leptotrombidium deliense]|uniref:C-type lectin domain-containing protein n=1 Tax=Leptotrombidium deliense TaxID=299467 RepID=A0A443S3G1_9ACAR|nr:hypothetical protein B4U80_11710 [Leptotrombidium deliense]